jgi:hypothetical protein
MKYTAFYGGEKKMGILPHFPENSASAVVD